MDNFDVDPEVAKSIREKFGISKDTFKNRADLWLGPKETEKMW